MAHPLVYEINTRCWLRELAEREQRPVSLAEVPGDQFELWRGLGFTHVWLMGVWTVGPRARHQALSQPEQRLAYSRALPGWQEEDVGGSPYAIADYHVPAELGGEAGLAKFRSRLNQEGLRL